MINNQGILNLSIEQAKSDNQMKARLLCILVISKKIDSILAFFHILAFKSK